MARLSEHFDSAELACPCCGKYLARTELLDLLEMTRSLAGGLPLSINSGYRCQAHNDSLAGSGKTSSHLRGLAADIAVPDAQRMKILVWAGLSAGAQQVEIGFNYVHLGVDQEKPAVLWINPRKFGKERTILPD